ncbi:MAG: 2-oxoacid:acceptor oxidoreductase subunit alpha, partial [Chloroflexota bacterium]
PVVIWPFPEKRIRELAKNVRAFVVPELNYGQIYYEVERCAAGNAKTFLVPHAGGTVHRPEDICEAILQSVR